MQNLSLSLHINNEHQISSPDNSEISTFDHTKSNSLIKSVIHLNNNDGEKDEKHRSSLKIPGASIQSSAGGSGGMNSEQNSEHTVSLP